MSFVKKTWDENTPILPDDLNRFEGALERRFNDAITATRSYLVFEEILPVPWQMEDLRLAVSVILRNVLVNNYAKVDVRAKFRPLDNFHVHKTFSWLDVSTVIVGGAPPAPYKQKGNIVESSELFLSRPLEDEGVFASGVIHSMRGVLVVSVSLKTDAVDDVLLWANPSGDLDFSIKSVDYNVVPASG